MTDINRTHMLKSLENGIRFDGRNLVDIRQPFDVKLNVSETAEGSAVVTLGNSIVMAGVTMELATPYPDTPNKGGLMVNVELVPMSHKDYEPGPPGIKAIEISRVIDRALREGGAVDFEKLCIVEGEKVWNILVDIIPINDDGNLFDAGALAALIAIKNAKLPTVTEEGVVDYKQKTDQGLPLVSEPLPVTIHKIGNYLIVDPTYEEENYSTTRLTVAVQANGNPCAIQKSGEEPLSQEQISEMVDIAIEKSKEYREILKKFS